MPPLHLVPLFHFGRWIAHLSPWVDYAILFAMTLLEGTGLPGVPFEPVFVAVGYLTGRGRLAYPTAVLAGAAGNLCGNLVGYLIGALLGGYLTSETARRFGVTPERLAAAAKWFERYGGRTVFIGRWFGPIRTPAILASGALRLELEVYTFWSSLAAVSWVGLWLLATWRFGVAAIRLWSRFGLWIAVVIAVLVIAAYFGWRRLAVRRGSRELP